ncbi:tRNA-dependent cyclodipeptide synthase [Pseudomonas asiatica]|uniref:tRNA-dependent cyclodipeptide synthase n=1 Tax=Pseudomonas asiatica TaxID=2219225 RepID=UPI00383A180A
MDFTASESTQKQNLGERYKAKISFVSPHTNRNNFEQEPQCFLGVSLENRNFTPNRFDAMLEWASRRFEKCLILVGDHIHRITLQSTRSMPEAMASQEALRLGRVFMQESQPTLDAHCHCTDFQFITCLEIQKSKEWLNIYTLLNEYFLQNSHFRESVEKFGRNYHRHNWHSLTDEQRKLRLDFSCQYFLEEFAVFAYLLKRGVKTMVYPGAFSTLSEIANGLYPNVPGELQKLTVVSLQLKRR